MPPNPPFGGAAAATDLLQAVLSLAADLDLPSLLERFVLASTELTSARYGAINIVDELGASTIFVQSGADDAIVAALGHPPHAVGVLGQIPAKGVLRLEDLTRHPAFIGTAGCDTPPIVLRPGREARPGRRAGRGRRNGPRRSTPRSAR